MIFDKLLLGSKEQIVKKMYNYMLEIKMQDETVKESMIKWTQNIGHNIDIDQWLKIWQNNIRKAYKIG